MKVMESREKKEDKRTGFAQCADLMWYSVQIKSRHRIGYRENWCKPSRIGFAQKLRWLSCANDWLRQQIYNAIVTMASCKLQGNGV